MADLKSIANMRIGGSKYPKKRRINLYQKQIKKGKIAAEIGVFAVFMLGVYGFSQFGVVRLLEEADRAEAIYTMTERQLQALQQSNRILGEVTAEYAHYGNEYLNEEEKKLPNRAMMLDSLKSNLFPMMTVPSVSITEDQMLLNGSIPSGVMFPDLVRGAENDPRVRYVSVSLEDTVSSESEAQVLAAGKNVDVALVVYFNVPEEDGEEQ